MIYVLPPLKRGYIVTFVNSTFCVHELERNTRVEYSITIQNKVALYSELYYYMIINFFYVDLRND